MPSEAAKNCDGEVYNRRTKASMVFRRVFEIVQRHNAQDGWGQRRRNFSARSGSRCPVALHFEVMNLGAKRSAHLRRGPGKINHRKSGVDEIYLEAERLKPSRYGVHVLLGHAESLAELLWGEPFVEVWQLGS